MYALRLIQLIENRAEHLSEGLMHRLKGNDRCIELLRRVPPDELRRRSHEIYHDLSDWLQHTTDSEIAERYTRLGMKRARQGVPYADLFWAISTTKEYLWEFMLAEGLFTVPIDLFGEIDLLHSMDRFFDRILYFAAIGYESTRLPESEHATRRHASAQR